MSEISFINAGSTNFLILRENITSCRVLKITTKWRFNVKHGMK